MTEITSSRIRPCLQYGTYVSRLDRAALPACLAHNRPALCTARLSLLADGSIVSFCRRTSRHSPQRRRLFLMSRLEDQGQVCPRRHGDLLHDLPPRTNPRRHDHADSVNAQGKTLLRLPRKLPGHASENASRKTTLHRLPRFAYQRSRSFAARRCCCPPHSQTLPTIVEQPCPRGLLGVLSGFP